MGRWSVGRWSVVGGVNKTVALIKPIGEWKPWLNCQKRNAHIYDSSLFQFKCWKYSLNDRSSHRRCSVRKGVLRNFTTFAGKRLCQSHFFIKLQAWGMIKLPEKKCLYLWFKCVSASVLKKRIWHRCFPVNFVKFLKTPFLQNTPGRLLLKWG